MLEHIYCIKSPTNYDKTQKLCVSVVIVMSHCIIQNMSGGTCLMWASGNGHVDTVRVLLEAKADPNINDEVKL